MPKTIITTGVAYTDIDGLACILGLAPLIPNSIPYIPGPLNHSVTSDIRSWPLKFETNLTISPEDKFILVDVTDPKYIAQAANEQQIIELFDHHYGFEEYWKAKLGDKAHIEAVGSCATLIFEQYKDKQPSTTVANLLYTAIFSNTLNFNSSVTTERDKNAFKSLKSLIDLPPDWIEKYFKDTEKAIFADPTGAIKNDTKVFNDEKLPFGLVIGQLELWDSRRFIETYLADVKTALEAFGEEHWFLTSPSISEGKNYIYTTSPAVRELLERAIGAKFSGDLGVTDTLLLRKEILKRLRN